jgi:hypothetical protein
MATIVADYVTIAAVLGATIGDSVDDPDKDPDWVTATEGTITLTPTVDMVQVTDSTGKTVAMVPFPIVCTIDAQGRLTYGGDTQVNLVDLGSSKVTPSVPRTKAAYNVTFTGVKMNGVAVNLKAFGINPSPDDAVAGVINLWDIAPLPTGTSGAAIARGQGVPSITTAATGDVITYDGTDTVWAAPAAGGVTSVNGKTGAAVLSAADVSAVPNTRAVNGKVLSADITLAASDVGAVPTTRQVAGHALSADVTLAKGDVGLGNVDNTADVNKAVLSATKLATARTIAGKSFDGTANVTLAAADVSAVATSAVGAASGVAALDAGSKVPLGNVPTVLAVINVEVSGSYPARPIYSGVAIWIGPDAPTGGSMVDGDVWMQVTS